MKFWLAVIAPEGRGELPEAMIKLYRGVVQTGLIGSTYSDFHKRFGFILTPAQEAQLRLDLYMDGVLSHAAYEICRIVKFHGLEVKVLEVT